MYQDIKERTFRFGIQIIHLTNIVPASISARVLVNQLVRSGTSIGANVEEAVAAYSKNDYIYKMNIALREARETHYWLRLMKNSAMLDSEESDPMISESEEIKKVLGAIVSKLRNKSKSKNIQV